MNTYYEIRLTPEQRRTLIELANMGLIEWSSTWEVAPDNPKRQAYERAVALLEEAKEHQTSRTCTSTRQHSGFRDGDKVLLECEMLGFGDHVSTIAIHHGTASPSEVVVVSNNLIYHKG